MATLITPSVRCDRLGVIMAPSGSVLEAEGVLNPGVARDRQGRLLLFPRIVAEGNVSRIGITRVGESGVERLGIVLEAGSITSFELLAEVVDAKMPASPSSRRSTAT